MLDINNMYQLTIFTSGFLFFAILFFNEFRFVNCLTKLKSINIFAIKNIKLSKSDNKITKSQESDCESPIESKSHQSNYIGIKKVSYSADTNFESKQKLQIKKTQSHNNILSFSSARNERMLSYSHTYGNLAKLVPPNTPSKAILDELIKNKSNNIMACCNPYCRKEINEPVHFAFDGYYCDEKCRHFVFQNMHTYWNQLY